MIDVDNLKASEDDNNWEILPAARKTFGTISTAELSFPTLQLSSFGKISTSILYWKHCISSPSFLYWKPCVSDWVKPSPLAF